MRKPRAPTATLRDSAAVAFAGLLRSDRNLVDEAAARFAVGFFPDGFDRCTVDLGEQVYSDVVLLALEERMYGEPLPSTFRDGDNIVFRTKSAAGPFCPCVRIRPDAVVFALSPVSRRHPKKTLFPTAPESSLLDEVVPHIVKFSKDTYRIIFSHQPDAAGSVLRFPKFDWPRCPFDWAVVAAIVDGPGEPESITLPLSGAWLGAEEDDISPILLKTLRPRFPGPKR